MAEVLGELAGLSDNDNEYPIVGFATQDIEAGEVIEIKLDLIAGHMTSDKVRWVVSFPEFVVLMEGEE